MIMLVYVLYTLFLQCRLCRKFDENLVPHIVIYIYTYSLEMGPDIDQSCTKWQPHLCLVAPFYPTWSHKCDNNTKLLGAYMKKICMHWIKNEREDKKKGGGSISSKSSSYRQRLLWNPVIQINFKLFDYLF
jgi:hypothetical protein